MSRTWRSYRVACNAIGAALSAALRSFSAAYQCDVPPSPSSEVRVDALLREQLLDHRLVPPPFSTDHVSGVLLWRRQRKCMRVDEAKEGARGGSRSPSYLTRLLRGGEVRAVMTFILPEWVDASVSPRDLTGTGFGNPFYPDYIYARFGLLSIIPHVCLGLS